MTFLCFLSQVVKIVTDIIYVQIHKLLRHISKGTAEFDQKVSGEFKMRQKFPKRNFINQGQINLQSCTCMASGVFPRHWQPGHMSLY